MKLRSTLLVLALTSAYPLLAQDHWVATWSTAQPMIRNMPPPPRPAGVAAPAPAPAAPAATPSSAAAPATPPPGGPGRALQQRGFNNQTVRMPIHTSVGG